MKPYIVTFSYFFLIDFYILRVFHAMKSGFFMTTLLLHDTFNGYIVHGTLSLIY